MRRLFKAIPGLFVYLCVGTILAQLVGVCALWWSGALNRERLFQAWAAIQGVDLPAMAAENAVASVEVDTEQISFDEIIKARVRASLDLDLREQALDKGFTDLQTLQFQLREERRRYDELRTNFEEHLAKLQQGASDSAIMEVQRTLEVMQPRQAKDQILRMLDEDAMVAVVTMIKNMPLDKRKKILAEFRTEEESEKLAEILKEIRLGTPEVNLISNARERLQDFGSLEQ